MDERVDSPIMANREKVCLSAVFAWAYARDKIALYPCKGVTDFKGGKQKLSGHRNAAMVATYNRKPDEVDAVE